MSNKMLDQIASMLAEGRRNSATRILTLTRIRSGSNNSLPGSGPPSSPSLNRREFDRSFSRVDEEAPEDDPNEEEGQSMPLGVGLGVGSGVATGAGDAECPVATAEFCSAIEIKHDKIRVYDPDLWRWQGNANVGNTVSALYAKVIVIMGMAFPMAETISTHIPPSYYEGFYLYLYFVSILVMAYLFGQMFHFHRKIHQLSHSCRGWTSALGRMLTCGGRSKDSGAHCHRGDHSHGHDHDRESSGSDDDHDMTRNGLIPTIYVEDTSEDVETGANAKHEAAIDNFQLQCLHKINGLVPKNADGCQLCEYLDKNDARRLTTMHRGGPRTNFGSFYLRVGAIAFGLGSVIYSALEFGQYFELKDDSRCYNTMQALTPAVRMVFTFMQMYFIFLNSKVDVSRTSLLTEFGMMHMIGTNLAVWLNVLVQETKHEILHFYDPVTGTVTPHGHHGEMDHDAGPSHGHSAAGDYIHHSRLRRGLQGPYNMFECRRSNVMGSLVANASPFLFPCTIEYSLICAAICYVMWKEMVERRLASIATKRLSQAQQMQIVPAGSATAGQPAAGTPAAQDHGSDHSRSPNQYTVDCSGSNKGLFIGLLLLVFTIVSVLVNFVLVKHHEYSELATVEIRVTELILCTTSTAAVLLGMWQMRRFRYESEKNLELDNILLLVAQSGSVLFDVFCIIGEQLFKPSEGSGHEQEGDPFRLGLAIPILSFSQVILQTLFILDASKRVVVTKKQARRKPGREVVTFLLVSNLAMWLISAFAKGNSASHPHQLDFYGVWAWTIIADVSMPLAIFYRFHSSVCLCEIWKKAHKLKAFAI